MSDPAGRASGWRADDRRGLGIQDITLYPGKSRLVFTGAEGWRLQRDEERMKGETVQTARAALAFLKVRR